MHDENDLYDEEDDLKSKSQVKREMLALQKLGYDIANLTATQQSKIPLDSSLRAAIEQAPKIKTNSAKKRHYQYLGKLLRNSDYEAIQSAYNDVIEQSHQVARQHHVVERWRDELVSDDEAMNNFLDAYPHTDRQNLRQLLRVIEKEKKQNLPNTSERKLFRFIRDTIDAHNENDLTQ